MSLKLTPNTLLDRQLCYNLWVKERKSIYDIPNILAEQGIVNSRKGKRVTPQGVWRSACLYMLDHVEEAQTDTVSYMSSIGLIFSEHEFREELMKKAKQFLSKSRFKKFIQDNPEFEPYI